MDILAVLTIDTYQTSARHIIRWSILLVIKSVGRHCFLWMPALVDDLLYNLPCQYSLAT